MISPVVLMGASTAQNEALKQAHSAKPDGGFRALYEQESRTQDLASSAKQFEALILGQILKSAQSSAQMAAIDGVADSSRGRCARWPRSALRKPSRRAEDWASPSWWSPRWRGKSRLPFAHR
jgi:hypothetical protein